MAAGNASSRKIKCRFCQGLVEDIVTHVREHHYCAPEAPMCFRNNTDNFLRRFESERKLKFCPICGDGPFDDLYEHVKKKYIPDKTRREAAKHSEKSQKILYCKNTITFFSHNRRSIRRSFVSRADVSRGAHSTRRQSPYINKRYQTRAEFGYRPCRSRVLWRDPRIRFSRDRGSHAESRGRKDYQYDRYSRDSSYVMHSRETSSRRGYHHDVYSREYCNRRNYRHDVYSRESSNTKNFRRDLYSGESRNRRNSRYDVYSRGSYNRTFGSDVIPNLRTKIDDGRRVEWINNETGGKKAKTNVLTRDDRVSLESSKFRVIRPSALVSKQGATGFTTQLFKVKPTTLSSLNREFKTPSSLKRELKTPSSLKRELKTPLLLKRDFTTSVKVKSSLPLSQQDKESSTDSKLSPVKDEFSSPSPLKFPPLAPLNAEFSLTSPVEDEFTNLRSMNGEFRTSSPIVVESLPQQDENESSERLVINEDPPNRTNENVSDQLK